MSTDASTRRLPVYILLDCSESMVGDGILSVEKGLNALIYELRSDPQALETVWVSLITFADTAKQIVPLSPLPDIHLKPLKVRPGTSMGRALNLVMECIRREVRKNTPGSKGDWRPIVFLLSDGEPTDDWEIQAKAVKSFHSSGPLNLVAIGCGEEVDAQILSIIAGRVLIMREYTHQDFQKLFEWISSSISSASKAVAWDSEDPLSSISAPDNLIDVSDSGNSIPRHDKHNQMFLALRCSKTKQIYLIRYQWTTSGYVPVRTHRVDNDYLSGENKTEGGMQLSSEQILGTLPCPYCENDVACVCACGALFCNSSSNQGQVICPECRSLLKFGEEGDFSVTGRLG